MEAITDAITLQNVIFALLALTSIWFLKILMKKEYEHLFRVLIVLIILILAVVFIQKNDANISILSSVKKRFSSEKKTVQYKYRVERGTDGMGRYIRFIFDEPRPAISLSMDTKGLRITDVKPVNAVLEHLNLPKVHSGVPDLSTITKSELDANIYRWDNYPSGVLKIEQSLCRNEDNILVRHCILSIIISSRYPV